MSHNDERGISILSDASKWVIVRDYNSFINLINTKFDDIELISFDHDLACYDNDGNELTGKDAVNYVVDYCMDNDKKFPYWYVHSDNTTGRENIIKTILNFLNRIEGKDVSNFRYYNKGIINNKLV
jgi:hypothetical protein